MLDLHLRRVLVFLLRRVLVTVGRLAAAASAAAAAAAAAVRFGRADLRRADLRGPDPGWTEPRRAHARGPWAVLGGAVLDSALLGGPRLLLRLCGLGLQQVAAAVAAAVVAAAVAAALAMVLDLRQVNFWLIFIRGRTVPGKKQTGMQAEGGREAVGRT